MTHSTLLWDCHGQSATVGTYAYSTSCISYPICIITWQLHKHVQLHIHSRMDKYACRYIIYIQKTSRITNNSRLTSKFCLILSGLTLFGITTTPRSTWNRINTWAGDLLCFLPISTILGSSRREGSPGLAHGLSGDPRGLYAVKTMLRSLQCWMRGFCVR